MEDIWVALIPLYIAALITVIKEVFKLIKRSFRYRSDCCCGSIEIDSPEPTPDSSGEEKRHSKKMPSYDV